MRIHVPSLYAIFFAVLLAISACSKSAPLPTPTPGPLTCGEAEQQLNDLRRRQSEGYSIDMGEIDFYLRFLDANCRS